MKNRIKIVAAILIVLLVSVMSGCGSTKLSDQFDKDTVLSKAQAVILDVNNGKYEEVYALFTDTLKSAITCDKLKNNLEEQLKGAGDYDSFQSTSVIGQKEKSTGDDCAIAVLVTKYASKTKTYTVSFDSDMNINGFYIK